MVKIQKTNKIKTRNCRPWRLANGATNEVVRRDLALRVYDNSLCRCKCGGQIALFVVCRDSLAKRRDILWPMAVGIGYTPVSLQASQCAVYGAGAAQHLPPAGTPPQKIILISDW